MKLRELFTDRMVYLCAVMRLDRDPAGYGGSPGTDPGNEMLKMSVLIVGGDAGGIQCGDLCTDAEEDMDYTQAVKDICLSTLLCIVTIPLVVSAAGVLF